MMKENKQLLMAEQDKPVQTEIYTLRQQRGFLKAPNQNCLITKVYDTSLNQRKQNTINYFKTHASAKRLQMIKGKYQYRQQDTWLGLLGTLPSFFLLLLLFWSLAVLPTAQTQLISRDYIALSALADCERSHLTGPACTLLSNVLKCHDENGGYSNCLLPHSYLYPLIDSGPVVKDLDSSTLYYSVQSGDYNSYSAIKFLTGETGIPKPIFTTTHNAWTSYNIGSFDSAVFNNILTSKKFPIITNDTSVVKYYYTGGCVKIFSKFQSVFGLSLSVSNHNATLGTNTFVNYATTPTVSFMWFSCQPRYKEVNATSLTSLQTEQKTQLLGITSGYLNFDTYPVKNSYFYPYSQNAVRDIVFNSPSGSDFENVFFSIDGYDFPFTNISSCKVPVLICGTSCIAVEANSMGINHVFINRSMGNNITFSISKFCNRDYDFIDEVDYIGAVKRINVTGCFQENNCQTSCVTADLVGKIEFVFSQFAKTIISDLLLTRYYLDETFHKVVELRTIQNEARIFINPLETLRRITLGRDTYKQILSRLNEIVNSMTCAGVTERYLVDMVLQFGRIKPMSFNKTLSRNLLTHRSSVVKSTLLSLDCSHFVTGGTPTTQRVLYIPTYVLNGEHKIFYEKTIHVDDMLCSVIENATIKNFILTWTSYSPGCMIKVNGIILSFPKNSTIASSETKCSFDFVRHGSLHQVGNMTYSICSLHGCTINFKLELSVCVLNIIKNLTLIAQDSRELFNLCIVLNDRPFIVAIVVLALVVALLTFSLIFIKIRKRLIMTLFKRHNLKKYKDFFNQLSHLEQEIKKKTIFDQIICGRYEDLIKQISSGAPADIETLANFYTKSDYKQRTEIIDAYCLLYYILESVHKSPVPINCRSVIYSKVFKIHKRMSARPMITGILSHTYSKIFFNWFKDRFAKIYGTENSENFYEISLTSGNGSFSNPHILNTFLDLCTTPDCYESNSIYSDARIFGGLYYKLKVCTNTFNIHHTVAVFLCTNWWVAGIIFGSMTFIGFMLLKYLISKITPHCAKTYEKFSIRRNMKKLQDLELSTSVLLICMFLPLAACQNTRVETFILPSNPNECITYSSGLKLQKFCFLDAKTFYSYTATKYYYQPIFEEIEGCACNWNQITHSATTVCGFTYGQCGSDPIAAANRWSCCDSCTKQMYLKSYWTWGALDTNLRICKCFFPGYAYYWYGKVVKYQQGVGIQNIPTKGSLKLSGYEIKISIDDKEYLITSLSTNLTTNSSWYFVTSPIKTIDFFNDVFVYNKNLLIQIGQFPGHPLDDPFNFYATSYSSSGCTVGMRPFFDITKDFPFATRFYGPEIDNSIPKKQYGVPIHNVFFSSNEFFRSFRDSFGSDIKFESESVTTSQKSEFTSQKYSLSSISSWVMTMTTVTSLNTSMSQEVAKPILSNFNVLCNFAVNNFTIGYDYKCSDGGSYTVLVSSFTCLNTKKSCLRASSGVDAISCGYKNVTKLQIHVGLELYDVNVNCTIGVNISNGIELSFDNSNVTTENHDSFKFDLSLSWTSPLGIFTEILVSLGVISIIILILFCICKKMEGNEYKKLAPIAMQTFKTSGRGTGFKVNFNQNRQNQGPGYNNDDRSRRSQFQQQQPQQQNQGRFDDHIEPILQRNNVEKITMNTIFCVTSANAYVPEEIPVGSRQVSSYVLKFDGPNPPKIKKLFLTERTRLHINLNQNKFFKPQGMMFTHDKTGLGAVFKIVSKMLNCFKNHTFDESFLQIKFPVFEGTAVDDDYYRRCLGLIWVKAIAWTLPTGYKHFTPPCFEDLLLTPQQLKERRAERLSRSRSVKGVSADEKRRSLSRISGDGIEANIRTRSLDRSGGFMFVKNGNKKPSRVPVNDVTQTAVMSHVYVAVNREKETKSGNTIKFKDFKDNKYTTKLSSNSESKLAIVTHEGKKYIDFGNSFLKTMVRNVSEINSKIEVSSVCNISPSGLLTGKIGDGEPVTLKGAETINKEYNTCKTNRYRYMSKIPLDVANPKISATVVLDGLFYIFARNIGKSLGRLQFAFFKQDEQDETKKTLVPLNYFLDPTNSPCYFRISKNNVAKPLKAQTQKRVEPTISQ